MLVRISAQSCQWSMLAAWCNRDRWCGIQSGEKKREHSFLASMLRGKVSVRFKAAYASAVLYKCCYIANFMNEDEIACKTLLHFPRPNYHYLFFQHCSFTLLAVGLAVVGYAIQLYRSNQASSSRPATANIVSNAGLNRHLLLDGFLLLLFGFLDFGFPDFGLSFVVSVHQSDGGII